MLIMAIPITIIIIIIKLTIIKIARAEQSVNPSSPLRWKAILERIATVEKSPFGHNSKVVNFVNFFRLLEVKPWNWKMYGIFT